MKKSYVLAVFACIFLMACKEPGEGNVKDPGEVEESMPDRESALDDKKTDEGLKEKPSGEEALKPAGDDNNSEEGKKESLDPADEKDEENSKADIKLDSRYKKLIEELKKGVQTGFTEEQQSTMEVTPVFFYGDGGNAGLGYTALDIDGNGVDELLIGETTPAEDGGKEGGDSIIYNIFTIVDEKMIRLVNGSERNRYYICDNAMIANEGSGGAAYSSWAYYNYKDSEIKIVESVFTDEDENGDLRWHYSNLEPYSEGSEDVTEEEAWEVIDKYTYGKIEFVRFL
ncbi:MAG: hypothetical protein K5931_00935 [Lachnospiraceae bacterium]|nr:hypothetical protein [Lachnospiraceae bacterium]